MLARGILNHYRSKLKFALSILIEVDDELQAGQQYLSLDSVRKSRKHRTIGWLDLFCDWHRCTMAPGMLMLRSWFRTTHTSKRQWLCAI